MIDRSKKIWFSFFAGMIVISGISHIFFISPLKKRAADLQRQYNIKMKSRTAYLARKQGPPTRMLLDASLSEKNTLETTYKNILKELSIRKEELLPHGTKRPSLYWLNVLQESRIRVSRKAAQLRAAIPHNLGFPDDIPDAAEVPALLQRLDVVENLAKLLLDSGIKEIKEISLGDEMVLTTSGELYVKKLNLSFVLSGSLDSVVQLIYLLQAQDKLYVIEDVELQAGEELLSARVVLSTVYLSEEGEKAPKKDDRRPRGVPRLPR